ncbi:MAG: hypothetical protein ACK559_00880, partial [bacterium]
KHHLDHLAARELRPEEAPVARPCQPGRAERAVGDHVGTDAGGGAHDAVDAAPRHVAEVGLALRVGRGPLGELEAVDDQVGPRIGCHEHRDARRAGGVARRRRR